MDECSDRQPYPSDLSDKQWEQLKEFVPSPVVGGPQETKYSRREIFNAMLYQKRTGCQWRFLPHDLPPWSLVKKYYYQWIGDGTFERALTILRERVRVQAGRNETPSLAILDSQSIKTTEVGGEKGFDAGKKIKGRKRHLLVDIMGLLLVVLITSASVQDRDGFPLVMKGIKELCPNIKTVLVDGAYNGDVIERSKCEIGIDVQMVKRNNKKGFHVIPKRWIVERSFGWLNRDRRLSKDYERNTVSSAARIQISFISIMLKRLT